MDLSAHLAKLRVIHHGTVAAKLCRGSHRRSGRVSIRPQQERSGKRQLLADRRTFLEGLQHLLVVIRLLEALQKQAKG